VETEDITESVEGKTRLLVPTLSLMKKVPPKNPAFFNPSAKLSRDLSIIAYRAFLLDANLNRRSFGDPLSGVGARALRVAVEVPEIDEVHLNDINPLAIQLAMKSAHLNFVERKCNFSVSEACRFLLANHTNQENRFAVVDLDPFGSPAPHIDCVMRSVLNTGLISVTATDTAVLCGIYSNVCFRKYYGWPIRCQYANEVAVRIILSLMSLIASRLGLVIQPLFSHCYSQYIRVYARVNLSSTEANRVHQKLGFLQHCRSCGNRTVAREYGKSENCNLCGTRLSLGGQLWLSRLFDKNFIKKMDTCYQKRLGGKLDNGYSLNDSMLSMCLREEDDIPYYFVTDEIASKLKTSPPPLGKVIDKLARSGYRASNTSLNTRGFKTDARINEILDVIR
jgi:tRNA (guanine26-N2/guanine27-N2)-dimethyltransferase